MGTLELLVQWQRAPAACSLPWCDPAVPLPADMRLVLQAANGDLTALNIGAAEAGCPGAEVKSAAVRFVRDVLLAPGADHYRRLGTMPDAANDEIRGNYRELISLLHPDRSEHGGDPALAAAVNEAYNTLKRSAARAKYDRLRQAACVTPAPAPPTASAAAQAASAATVRMARKPRPQWRSHRAPGRVATWLRSQAPARLKVFAFGGVLTVALLAVLLAAARPVQTVLAIPADPPAGVPVALAMPALNATRVAPATTPIPATAMSVRAATATEAKEGVGTVRHEQLAPVTSAGASATVGAVAASLARAVTTSTMTPASPTAVPVAPALPVVAALSLPPEPVTAAAPAVAPKPVPAVAHVPEPQVARETTLPAAAPVVARVPGPRQAPAPALTAADVEVVVARFVAAYNSGNLHALAALVDPDVAQSDRMLFTFANYGRVFAETSSRRLDLRVLDVDTAHGRVELAMRATLTDAANARRTSAGTLTLTLRMHGPTAVITDLACREADAA